MADVELDMTDDEHTIRINGGPRLNVEPGWIVEPSALGGYAFFRASCWDGEATADGFRLTRKRDGVDTTGGYTEPDINVLTYAWSPTTVTALVARGDHLAMEHVEAPTDG